MAFIGIITDTKSEIALKEMLDVPELHKEINPIYITEKNIDNIKNIKFETIILNREFSDKQTLEKVLRNTKNLTINIDNNYEIDKIEDLNVTVITYGFNSKSTITASSVEEDTLICLQRNIVNKWGNVIEPQEIKGPITRNGNAYDSMIFIAVHLFYLK